MPQPAASITVHTHSPEFSPLSNAGLDIEGPAFNMDSLSHTYTSHGQAVYQLAHIHYNLTLSVGGKPIIVPLVVLGFDVSVLRHDNGSKVWQLVGIMSRCR